ncbi:MOSC domain-containing protein [Rhodovulum sulfidophilum]|uniref:MOSC domain-containing protein n=1 Tax=Rhodovulum visakhapatnamense TaxID=364297 RepID=A0ABS1RGD6_9RHOB|nr:MOSC domain-containing protein [Rhodovulum visakhapatnamense]MBL3569191.1 MOSC domain-containing protein [Rhodovulum visakhapatnamense]MBL3578693.1 MOSC domain-containing protein [Rhodovulum visakhapatnamense]OLS44372.1 MOSC domain-containing protein [Rhodovulum sulfidophilum]
MQGKVVTVARDGTHRFSKTCQPSIRLIAGLGVEGDAHAGVTVQHRSRVRRDPTVPNLRQVHLIGAELLETLAAKGFALAPGDLGENVLTRGLDLLGLPEETVLHLGATARVRLTGLRNPCAQIESFRPGLLAEVLEHRADGSLRRKAGVMGVVETGGELRPGDPVGVELPPGPHRPLDRV